MADRPSPDERWCALEPDDPCEHKYLRVRVTGFVCASCGEPVRFSLHDLVRDADPPSHTENQ